MEGIGKAAQEAGFESWIAYGRQSNPSTSKNIRIGSKTECYEHVFETRLFDNHGLSSRHATISFLKDVDRINPDLIHLHNIHGYYINYRLLFYNIIKRKVPVVWTLHDCWSFTGHCSHFMLYGCDRWKSQCHDCPQKRTYPISLLFDRSRNNYTDKRMIFTSVPNLTLVPVSYWLDNLLSQSFFKNNIHFCIHNGINTDVFSPVSNSVIREQMSIHQQDFILLGVTSQWSTRKGLQDFIELSKRLSGKYKIILIGLTK
ncbi:MAG: glycosyltransferase, partial [Bacteroidales bacterium]|nr:glycosyltransferase [Bacteroidales bacterium]